MLLGHLEKDQESSIKMGKVSVAHWGLWEADSGMRIGSAGSKEGVLGLNPCRGREGTGLPKEARR